MRKTNPSTCRDASLKPSILMNSSVPEDSETTPETDAAARLQPVYRPEGSAHRDPITGEPHAHPVGVGVGALGAGATGGLIGAILGPVGAVIGAAFGAVAGGLAGKEVAEASENKAVAVPEASVATPASDPGGSYATEAAYDSAEASRAPENFTGESIANSGGTHVASEAFSTSSESVEEVHVNHSGLGHVAAASLVSEEAPTASGFTAPAKATDPVAEDMDRQTAPETVPFNASASPVDEFEPQRLPLTPEDTDVHVASVPNDVPKIDEPKGPLSHDLLFEHGDMPDPASQSFVEPGTQFNPEENTPESAVRTKAYYNYLNRQQSGRQGDELGDWTEAEYDAVKG